jgi:hypothetical protein
MRIAQVSEPLGITLTTIFAHRSAHASGLLQPNLSLFYPAHRPHRVGADRRTGYFRSGTLSVADGAAKRTLQVSPPRTEQLTYTLRAVAETRTEKPEMHNEK